MCPCRVPHDCDRLGWMGGAWREYCVCPVLNVAAPVLVPEVLVVDAGVCGLRMPGEPAPPMATDAGVVQPLSAPGLARVSSAAPVKACASTAAPVIRVATLAGAVVAVDDAETVVVVVSA